MKSAMQTGTRAMVLDVSQQCEDCTSMLGQRVAVSQRDTFSLLH